jgi:hypothetical protein
MGGDALLFTLVAGFAVFLGLKVERMRRTREDAQRLAKAAARMRAARFRETVYTMLFIGGAVTVLFLLGRGG